MSKCCDCEWVAPPHALVRDLYDHQMTTGHSGFRVESGYAYSVGGDPEAKVRVEIEDA